MITDILILIMEWIGTVAFAISGAIVAIRRSLDLFGVIIVGCVTAVGGGMLRDICSAEIPFIFRKHVYLIPTLCGSVFYAFTYKHIPHPVSMLLAIGIIISLRVLAIIFKWNLPIPSGAGHGIKDSAPAQEKEPEEEAVAK